MSAETVEEDGAGVGVFTEEEANRKRQKKEHGVSANTNERCTENADKPSRGPSQETDYQSLDRGR